MQQDIYKLKLLRTKICSTLFTSEIFYPSLTAKLNKNLFCKVEFCSTIWNKSEQQVLQSYKKLPTNLLFFQIFEKINFAELVIFLQQDAVREGKNREHPGNLFQPGVFVPNPAGGR